MSSVKIIKKPVRPGVPDDVLEQLVGVSVSCNPGPSVAYFGTQGPPPSWVRYIDQQTIGRPERDGTYFVSSHSLQLKCGYEGRFIARDWLVENMSDCWIVFTEKVCEYQP